MKDASRNPEDFYNLLANNYDTMLPFNDRLAAASQWVNTFQQRFGSFASAADIGCGTGAYALAMAKTNAFVLGVDVSSHMLEKAQTNAGLQNLNIRFVKAGLETVAEHIENPVDLIVCMGNTLPHILSPQQLSNSVVELYKKLTLEGKLVLQLLNYEKILNKQERLVDVSRHGDIEFIRFYDFLDPLVRFNLLEIDWRSNKPQVRLNATMLYPYRCDELQSLLESSGFIRIECFGGLDFSEFLPSSSDTLLLVAGR